MIISIVVINIARSSPKNPVPSLLRTLLMGPVGTVFGLRQFSNLEVMLLLFMLIIFSYNLILLLI